MLKHGCAAHPGTQILDIIFLHFTSFSFPDFSDWQRPGREDGSAQGRGSQCADLPGKLAAKPPLRGISASGTRFPEGVIGSMSRSVSKGIIDIDDGVL
ncbi:hypothetical protein, partial [Allorhizobium ampelinum]|uniref:hypothetical protein n=1 Tax=Allorhizobium ampelinum TaxID=3025782 RepID=UPI001F160C78